MQLIAIDSKCHFLPDFTTSFTFSIFFRNLWLLEKQKVEECIPFAEYLIQILFPSSLCCLTSCLYGQQHKQNKLLPNDGQMFSPKATTEDTYVMYFFLGILLQGETSNNEYNALRSNFIKWFHTFCTNDIQTRKLLEEKRNRIVQCTVKVMCTHHILGTCKPLSSFSRPFSQFQMPRHNVTKWN